MVGGVEACNEFDYFGFFGGEIVFCRSKGAKMVRLGFLIYLDTSEHTGYWENKVSMALQLQYEY